MKFIIVSKSDFVALMMLSLSSSFQFVAKTSSLRTSNTLATNLPWSALFQNVSYNLIIDITPPYFANRIDSKKICIQAKINDRNQS